MIYERDELRDGIEPLSEDERRWLRRLERILQGMPKRLLLVEAGDSLTLVDREAASSTDLYDGGAADARIVLADVRHSGFKVTGVAG